MEPIFVDWATFKAFATSRGLSIQYVSIDSTYRMRLADGYFCLDCSLAQDAGTDCVDFETNYKPGANKITSIQTGAFSSKVLPNGKKLYVRNHGVQQTVTAGSNTINFTIPYAWAKMTEAEIINGEALDYIDFKVYDTAQGTYSGVPNYMLNQFGFSVNVSPNFYQRVSNYDADCYQGMIFRLIYNSVSAKTVGINLILNEVK
jgi:hypothetical protein